MDEGKEFFILNTTQNLPVVTSGVAQNRADRSFRGSQPDPVCGEFCGSFGGRAKIICGVRRSNPISNRRCPERCPETLPKL